MGCAYTGVKPEKVEKRMTVGEFCKKHPRGNFYVFISNHCTAVVNGICYDTWNPAKKCVCRYYEVDKEWLSGKQITIDFNAE